MRINATVILHFHQSVKGGGTLPEAKERRTPAELPAEVPLKGKIQRVRQQTCAGEWYIITFSLADDKHCAFSHRGARERQLTQVSAPTLRTHDSQHYAFIEIT